MTIRREGGLWVAPFPVDGVLHLFAIDALRSDNGVGGWLSEEAICAGPKLAVGARLATKAEAFTAAMCTGCWGWLLEHQDVNLIYSPPGESSIAEPAGVGIADLAASGWRADA